MKTYRHEGPGLKFRPPMQLDIIDLIPLFNPNFIFLEQNTAHSVGGCKDAAPIDPRLPEA